MSIVLLAFVWAVVMYFVTFKSEFDAEELQKGALFGVAVAALVLVYNVIVNL